MHTYICFAYINLPIYKEFPCVFTVISLSFSPEEAAYSERNTCRVF